MGAARHREAAVCIGWLCRPLKGGPHAAGLLTKYFVEGCSCKSGHLPDEALQLAADTTRELHNGRAAHTRVFYSQVIAGVTSKRKQGCRAFAALVRKAHLYVQEMPSFSLIMLPSLESITASVSPSAFFFRNRFRPEAQDH